MSSSLFDIQEHVVPCQHVRSFPGATRDQEALLRLHVKQYTPLVSLNKESSLPKVTIIAANGNGFVKEMQEPMYDYLLTYAEANGFAIGSIWNADNAMQGKSYMLNEDQASDEPGWADHSRDMLSMVNHFRDQMHRPLVGIGHSMGGNQMMRLAIIHPRLFTTIIFLDPVIHCRPDHSHTIKAQAPEHSLHVAFQSTYRRDIWPSRADAAASFRKSAFFQAWTPRVLELFVEHGLRDLPTRLYPGIRVNTDSSQTSTSVVTNASGPPVTLMTPVGQEAWSFLRPSFRGSDALGRFEGRELPCDHELNGTFHRSEPSDGAWMLPHLRPSAFWIYGEKSFTMDSMLKDCWEVTGTGPGGSGGMEKGKSKRVIMEGVGHTLPFEAPERTAELAAQWLGQEIQTWKVGEDRWNEYRKAMHPSEHLNTSAQWKENAPRPQRPGKKESRM